jgi:hypothetical protein
MAVIAGDSDGIATLRGVRPAGTSRQEAPGYYEALTASVRWESDESAPGMPPGWRPFGGPETGIVEETRSYLRWKMRPNLDLRWNGTDFRTNSLGYRTPEVSLAKAKGVYRVVLFGSSNTMGYGVHDVDVFARHLERWLNERIGPSHRAEVVNLAVAGDSPTRKLYRLQQEAANYDADWLLFDASALDGWLEGTHIYFVLQRGLPIAFPFVRDAVQRSGITVADSLEAVRVKFSLESEVVLDSVFRMLGAEARRLQRPLTVLTLPRADDKAKSPRVFRRIALFARRHGLDLMDLSDAFDHLDLEEFRISAWDKHPSARGHQAIHAALCQAITRRGELPGLAESRTLLVERD